MTYPAPRVTIAKPSRSNGVLSIAASATQKRAGPAPDGSAPRAAIARLKIIIRRLPPGLTQAEFDESVGDEWKANNGKVDWATYKPGKVSKDPAKPSRPSRAYLHLTKQEHITLLSEKIRNTAFNDAKGSAKDSSLLGPPSVEFAPYGRVPSSRPRKDARQGMIDQDTEFIDFLESLTNPISKSTGMDQENDSGSKSKEKVTVTPLIQYLKDKKANKGKDNAIPPKSARHSRQDSKDSKPAAAMDNKSVVGNTNTSSPKKRSAQAVKVEQAAREVVKVLNKQAVNSNKNTNSLATSAAAPASTAPPVALNSTPNPALAERRRERGNASAAAKILQRDLGLGTNAGGRGGRRGVPGAAARSVASNAPAAAKQAADISQSPQTPVTAVATAAATPSTGAGVSSNAKTPNTTKTLAQTVPPSGPAASRVHPRTNVSTNSSATGSGAGVPTSKPIQPPSTATQAFLKHANPSQGITEPLLEAAFAEYGAVSKVEIDKKKGFAYVDFAEPENLQKAIKASPIKVAQGQVVVLERKTGPTLQARNVRGGPMMGNRGGGMPGGGRGGSMRGRGGFGRGAANMPNANNTKQTPAPRAATPTQAPVATPPTTSQSAAEISTPQPTAPLSTKPPAESTPADDNT
ncbi:hypothetical protein MMC28_008267 [Mycoblastus sanguinarius]|nr:hypothetical protein [Mycoblastus sanguinarius]